MLVGVVSDTHNRVDHVRQIINIFNTLKVGLVIHAGDITSANTLQCFSELNAPLKGVYGNNDLSEEGLEETSLRNGFDFKLPPQVFTLEDKKIAVFHQPEPIETFLLNEKKVDLVVHGHTHRFREEKINGIKIINPGECAGMMKGKNSVGIVDLKDLNFERVFF